MNTSSKILATALAWLFLGAHVHAETLRIGMATAQTGGLASYDGPVVEGARIAIDEINAAGGIGGKILIETQERDVRSDSAQTSIAAQELVDSGVNILVLPCDADPSLAAAAIVSDAKVPAFSTCATSPTLTLIGGEFMFGNVPADNVQATVSASWALDQGLKTAYILYSPDSQYTTLPLYFADAFEAGGGTVVGQATYKMGQQDFSAEVTNIKAMDPAPEVIMTAAYEPDFPSFIKALRAAGINSVVIGSDAIDSPTTFALGAASEGVVFTTPGYPSEGSRLAAFNDLYEKVTGQASTTVFHAIGYDLIKSIEAAVIATDGDTDPVVLRDAISQLENVQGATSLITYKGTDGMPIREVSLVRVNAGKPEFLGQHVPDPALVPKPRM